MSLIDKIEENTIISPKGKMYTNKENIPYLTALFSIYQSEQSYKGKLEDDKISVTTLIGPIRKYLYAMKNKDTDQTLDVAYLFNSAKGSNLHSGFEEAIKYFDLPDLETEQTVARKIEDYWITGTYDFKHNNRISDLKHVSNYALKLLNEDKEKLSYVSSIEEGLQKFPNYYKYALQMSIYRWLCNDESIELTGSIIFSLNNGSGFEKYPINSEVIFPLFTSEEIEEFITNRIKKIKHYIATDTMPLCTPVERGTKPASYSLKRYSQKTGKYRTVAGSKFDDYSSLQNFITTKGKPGDKTEIIEPSHILCQYCTWNSICEQSTQGE